MSPISRFGASRYPFRSLADPVGEGTHPAPGTHRAPAPFPAELGPTRYRRGSMKTRFGPPVLAVLIVIIVAACTDAGRSGSAAPTSTAPAGTPSTTPTAPGPTPIAVDVASAADAAALVIATDPRFEGAIALTPDVIGASRWWEATPLAGGGYHVTITIGWGDCPSGCIDEHVWDFEVSADGQVTFLGESGDPISSGAIPGDT